MAAVEQLSSLEKGETTPLLRVLEQKQKKYDDVEASTTVSWKSSRTIRTIVVMVVLGIFGLGYSDFSRNSVFSTSTSLGFFSSAQAFGVRSQCYVQRNSKAIWASDTALISSSSTSAQNCKAIYQIDGNFVIYAYNDEGVSKVLWETGTKRDSIYMLLQDDGNIVTYGLNTYTSELFFSGWSSWAKIMPDASKLPSTESLGWLYDASKLRSTGWFPLNRLSKKEDTPYQNSLMSSEGVGTLEIGEFIRSMNGNYILVMQPDCNLVEYHAKCELQP